ncbi:hypothetical protein C2869_08575 [Saccharobesus litoralis]|uniref:Uncharacterized protein n=1 Tax=Saccharobesus litoralis TaxID=2172099 RepID=A0A2S0VQK8_9ALTE|nr:hypothetical protein [Saccharobesus litoralis]AWB66479.1 hypothetical protein C2869_08575 [Saccharobesus litoralis]
MASAIRFLVTLGCLAIALIFMSQGAAPLGAVFIILGIVFEAVFWWRLGKHLGMHKKAKKIPLAKANGI